MSAIPSTIGKYQIIREIARSNDIVYEAYDPVLDRRVALKELNVPAGTSEAQLKDRVDRFEREARAAGRLSNPNIMTVYEVGQDSGRHYMAMEFLDGHTLRNELDTHGKIGFDEAIEIAKAVLSGLEHAHSNGVVHRDIKPDNIQILSNREVKITDFGIARLTFQPNLTMDGQVFGTPSYMSPEQVRGGEIDARSDLFSVGVLLYEMLVGSKPFVGDNVIAITHAILNYDPPQPDSMNYLVWLVIQKALDKTPAMRYASAKDMLAALARAAASAGDVVLDPRWPNPMTTPPVIAAPPPVFDPHAYPYAAPSPPTVYPQQQHMPLPTPIYYPPPPRKPLFTPQQQATIGRTVMIIFVLTTFTVLVLMAISYAVGQFGPPPQG